MRKHRAEERTFVERNTSGLRGLVGELLDGLRRAMSDDLAGDQLVRDAIGSLGEAARSDSMDEVRKQLANTMAVVSEVLNERQARYDELKEHYVSTGSFALDEDGNQKKDVDGNPQLALRAQDKLTLIEDEKVMVYESTIMETYKKNATSLTSLMSKVEKIDKANVALAAMAAEGVDIATDKKAASQMKKRTAYQKQIGKVKEYSGNALECG